MTNKENQGKKFMTKPARNGMPSLMNSIRLTTACATQRGSVCSTESSVAARKVNGGIVMPTAWIVNSTSRHQYRLMSPLF